MPRPAKKISPTEKLVTHTLQQLSPRDALAVELAIETVRSKGRIGSDQAQEVVGVANTFAALLGWQKEKRTPLQVAKDVLSGDDGAEG